MVFHVPQLMYFTTVACATLVGDFVTRPRASPLLHSRYSTVREGLRLTYEWVRV